MKTTVKILLASQILGLEKLWIENEFRCNCGAIHSLYSETKEELDMILYLETHQKPASIWNLISMTTVGNGIHTRVYLMRRSTLQMARICTQIRPRNGLLRYEQQREVY